MAMMVQQTKVRWMIRADVPEVLAIEQACFEPGWAWGERELLDALKQRAVIAMVADHGGKQIRGYMVYELMKSRLELLNIAVAPAWQRQGIGAGFLQKLKGKVCGRRTLLATEVVETNLPAQLFLRSQGLRCTGILRAPYEGCVWDAYRFEYQPQP